MDSWSLFRGQKSGFGRILISIINWYCDIRSLKFNLDSNLFRILDFNFNLSFIFLLLSSLMTKFLLHCEFLHTHIYYNSMILNEN